MPRKYHPLSKGTASRRERRRHPTPAPPDAGAGVDVAPGGAALPPTPSLGPAPVAQERIPLPEEREAAVSRPPLGRSGASQAAKSRVYHTPEAKYLGREFRNIMALTLGMSLLIVVLSFFLR